MLINGRFIGKRPFFLLSVKSNRPRMRKQINFLMDTGSDITGLSTKDLRAMGLSKSSLGKPIRSTTGLKDQARKWEIKGAELRAKTDNQKLAKFDPKKLYVIETNEACPSLLGRDFLEEFNFKLVCDVSKKEIYLEN